MGSPLFSQVGEHSCSGNGGGGKGQCKKQKRCEKPELDAIESAKKLAELEGQQRFELDVYRPPELLGLEGSS